MESEERAIIWQVMFQVGLFRHIGHMLRVIEPAWEAGANQFNMCATEKHRLSSSRGVLVQSRMEAGIKDELLEAHFRNAGDSQIEACPSNTLARHDTASLTQVGISKSSQHNHVGCTPLHVECKVRHNGDSNCSQLCRRDRGPQSSTTARRPGAR
eukprot:6458467-Amphidinium_carterae.1